MVCVNFAISAVALNGYHSVEILLFQWYCSLSVSKVQHKQNNGLLLPVLSAMINNFSHHQTLPRASGWKRALAVIVMSVCACVCVIFNYLIFLCLILLFSGKRMLIHIVILTCSCVRSLILVDIAWSQSVLSAAVQNCRTLVHAPSKANTSKLFDLVGRQREREELNIFANIKHRKIHWPQMSL